MQLLKFGGISLSIERAMSLILAVVVFIFILSVLRKFAHRRLETFESPRRANLQTVSRFAYYFIFIVGLIVILQMNGVDLTTLTLLTGALGIGIGFGLQAITNNLISGIIILFERPIKIGDRIEVGEISGNVIDISLRATTIRTNDNLAVIIPNSEFITGRVINWTFHGEKVRFRIGVNVAHDSSPEKVKRLLLEVAHMNEGILKDPAPDVLFSEFAESSLSFVLRVWTRSYSSRPGALKSEINYAIHEKFRENGIELPYPQLDIHLKREKRTEDPDARPASQPAHD